MQWEACKEKALALVGQGYIYGAKGQTCSPAFREQQAAQYPEQADNILNVGAKWDGMPVWDCAQLTRAVAKEAGISLVSGATSQWTKTDWARKGEIDTLAENELCFVYRQSDGRMQHTGVALGDGTCVHARGVKYGVVRQSMAECAWTHWASPFAETVRRCVWAASGATVNVRQTPNGRVLARLPIGTVVEVVGAAADWSRIRHEGGTAYMQSAFLRDVAENDWQAILARLDALEARLDQAGI